MAPPAAISSEFLVSTDFPPPDSTVTVCHSLVGGCSHLQDETKIILTPEGCSEAQNWVCARECDARPSTGGPQTIASFHSKLARPARKDQRLDRKDRKLHLPLSFQGSTWCLAHKSHSRIFASQILCRMSSINANQSTISTVSRAGRWGRWGRPSNSLRNVIGEYPWLRPASRGSGSASDRLPLTWVCSPATCH